MSPGTPAELKCTMPARRWPPMLCRQRLKHGRGWQTVVPVAWALGLKVGQKPITGFARVKRLACRP
jgi:hypothetical protein